ncbi:chloride channel protein [Variovorax sp.]|uniref:chloride channel protein n=1 Tax=Variovorax sp. TaxID=1871043 RepID=UPI002D3087D1|nr:chloride channel protein [Variovorax sp.]HYP83700.1 chloride channel protein [Variovorax sp.]
MTHAHAERGDFDLNRRLLPMALLACLIGLLATGGAWVLLAMIRLFTNLFFFQTLSLESRSPAGHALGAAVIALPVLGGLIVGLIARFGTDKIRGHGIPEAIEAILFNKSLMSPKVAVLKPVSSGIAIGSGGPFGAEGPIIMTGGAIGSLLAQHFHLSAAERKALLVAGAAAGMTAVFGTPLAAVLLAIEVLLFELRPRSLLPVALACAVAGFVRPWVLEPGPLFALHVGPTDGWALPVCLLAGLLSGLLATGLSRTLYAVEDLFNRLPVHWMWWPALGGIAVGIGGFLEPRTFGVGYDVISDLLHLQIGSATVLAIVLVKTVIWIIALGSLTSGGVLAPVMTIGAGLGALLAAVLPGHDGALLPLLCMAGVLGGVMHAPLMAAVFAFGVTGDPSVLLPLLATTAVSYGCTVLLMRRSILTEKIARRGRHVWREISVDPLERHFVEEWMTREVQTLPASMTVAQALAGPFGAAQRHRACPVVDDDGRLLGMADRAMLLARPAHETCAEAFAGAAPPAFTLGGEHCRTAATRMARLGVERLAVVDDAASLRLVGLLSRSDLVEPTLSHHHEEEVRERSRGLRRSPGPRPRKEAIGH